MKNRRFIIVIPLLFALLLVFVFNSEREKIASSKFMENPRIEEIGKSVEGRPIETYTYGDGENTLLFIGGIHGGYEWNSVVLAYQYIDHINKHYKSIPENVTVVVIPSLNPDGIFKVVGKEGRFKVNDAPTTFEETAPGRFNANGVDLNRNFACMWQPESTWRGEKVSAGTEVFSEPESKALKNYVEKNKPKAVVFWHSEGDAVFASRCEDGTLPKTLDIMHTYADAAGYEAIETFGEYKVTGDSEGWLAAIGIPAITVELSTHEAIEFEKNLKGVNALIESFGK